MVAYHFYSLDDLDHITGRQSFECADDLAALAQARALSSRCAIEVWDSNRRVAKVKKCDAPLATSDSASL